MRTVSPAPAELADAAATAGDARMDDDFLRQDNALVAVLRWAWLAVLAWVAVIALVRWAWAAWA